MIGNGAMYGLYCAVPCRPSDPTMASMRSGMKFPSISTSRIRTCTSIGEQRLKVLGDIATWARTRQNGHD